MDEANEEWLTIEFVDHADSGCKANQWGWHRTKNAIRVAPWAD